MPAAKPPEFRRRAVELVRRGDQPLPQIARDIGISESCLRGWVRTDDVDSGRRDGISSDERKELVELRRRNRMLETAVEILSQFRSQKSLSVGDARRRSPIIPDRF